MARKPRRNAASTSSAKPTLATLPNDADPQSWLYLNPAGPVEGGLVFGVLRKTYAGRTNTAVEFGWRKAHPIKPASGLDLKTWLPTSERVEVLLPAGADDALLDPVRLLTLMDACAVAHEKALLVYLTLPLGDVGRVHEGWERARAFARERFARDRGLAVMLALHAPGRIGSVHPLHAHALIVPRAAGKLGLAYGAYDEELIHDRGQAIVEAMWRDHIQTWR